MIINMWSGPRNISTALMRSFENRDDTSVIDEPFYAYYLKKSNLKHPMYNEIIKRYETNYKKIIDTITTDKKNKIIFIKHMTHHINIKSDLNWIKKGKNIFLLRHPNKVILSYIKKNKLKKTSDIGFPEQLKIFNYIKLYSNTKNIIINSEYLLKDPEKILRKICNIINIDFDIKMLSWAKGNRITDGIWSKIWYQKVIHSTSFQNNDQKITNIPSEYEVIYEKCLKIYNELNKYSINI